MKRRRPETTFYLGEDLYRDLEEYRKGFPVPPSASALIREALRRFLDEAKEHEGTLPPRAWVEATEPWVARLATTGISVSTEGILRALDEAERCRTSDMLGDGR